MALISLFFQTRAKLDQMELDVSLNETHEATAQLSQNEIEDGSAINDNIVLAPLKLTIEGVVSKTPLGTSALIGSAATALAGVAGGALGGSTKLAGAVATVGVASLGGLVASAVGVGASGGAKSRTPADVYAYLLQLRDLRTPFSVVTALKLYEDVVVTSLQAPRNAGTSGMLRFTATFEQVKIVRAQTVDLGVLANVPGAAKASKLGKQATSAAATKTSSDASLLFQGAQYFGVVQ